MITLPSFDDPFTYENGFYLTCDAARIGKLLAHYELYKMALCVPGALVECGVFKGASLARFAALRKLFEDPAARQIVGFDMFGPFPDTNFEADVVHREHFVKAAGLESIDRSQLLDVLRHKGCDENVELVAGNICETVPDYVRNHPELRINLLNLDTDIYEPAVTILEQLYPRLERGGILILDDYGVFPGETQAVNDYFQHESIVIKKFPFSATPCYIIKE